MAEQTLSTKAIKFVAKDLVLDFFAGSNTSGEAAEVLDRKWIAFEKDRTYLAASALRFVDEGTEKDVIKELYRDLLKDGCDAVKIESSQMELRLYK